MQIKYLLKEDGRKETREGGREGKRNRGREGKKEGREQGRQVSHLLLSTPATKELAERAV